MQTSPTDTPSADERLVERTAELVQTEIDGDLVALDVAQGNCFGFNATASRVWQLIETPQSVDAIVAALTEEFEIEPAECRAAVTGLLDEMVAGKLVRLREAA